jgi:hypothetical protein
MARTVGPILAIGAITVANQSIVNDAPIQWRVPVATAIAAGIFALAEKAWEEGAVALAYLALVSVLFVRLDPATPAPVESFVTWWNSGGK